MATTSMDFTSGLSRPSGSKAKAENYLGSTAYPYALRAISAAMGSKHEDADNLYDAVFDVNPKEFGKYFNSGASTLKETTPTQNIEKTTPTQTINSVLTQKIANNLANA